MRCLEAVESLRLPGWYIAGGFLRNAVWDARHRRQPVTPLDDVDVIYFEPADLSTATERNVESGLRALLPDVPWEVRNQARMHVRNRHAPYRGCEQAIAQWPETQTCVAIRMESGGALTIIAPYGLAENWSLRVTPNPVVPYPAAVFNERVRSKRWLELWPRLRVEWAQDP
ncbi:MAG: hypothetical protein GEU73_04200 [Chloroflexi bacterium]|nr:hypothetical protein [Chloroflexota bacterium]